MVYHSRFGLFGYNQQKKEVVHIQPSQLGGVDASNNRISGATASPDGMLWLVKSDLSLAKVDVVGRKIVQTIPSLSGFLRPSDVDHGIFADSHSNLWIYSRNENEGLLRYNLSLGQANVYEASEGAGSINSNVITAVIEDDFGNILVGTDHGGLSRIHSISGKIETYKNDPADKNSLAQNSITCLYRDNSGIIWIGTYKKGVSYYHPDLFKISTYILHPFKKIGSGTTM
jgi:ligand-binding sensor domain-containing protein